MQMIMNKEGQAFKIFLKDICFYLKNVGHINHDIEISNLISFYGETLHFLKRKFPLKT